jgi:hypothetical protein
VLRNELVVKGMAHLMLGWRDYMKLVSITSYDHTVRYRDGRDIKNSRFRCRGKCKTLRNLPTGNGIELVFFMDIEL